MSMKELKKYMSLGIIVIIVMATLVSHVSADTGKHLFILSGQSNMAGLDHELTFVPTVQKEFGKDNVIVVKYAKGGTPIRSWFSEWKAPAGDSKDYGKIGKLYANLLKNVKMQIKDVNLKTVTVCWMQGERDAKEGLQGVYRKSLEGLIDQVRNDLSFKQV
ncbi:MAG: hypothetical protein HQL32_13945 [Planctomycetes bacterium]|nr:hypothetical protein [Planctomycetota bacterium]